MLIVCQIETSEGVSNIEEISEVDGIDMLFIGPMDLSTSIGKFGQFSDPVFIETVSLAKEKGRNRVQVYQSNDKQLIHHAREMAAIHEVSQAIQENRMVLYRQKIKSIRDSKSSHYEVLLRMVSTEGDLIAPNDFIPAAEKYGLIRQVDHWVIENTFKKILRFLE